MKHSFANANLQRVDRAHPAQGHGRFGRDVFHQRVRERVDKGGFVFKIGIHAAFARLTLLRADRGRDQTMRKSNRPTLPVEHRAQFVIARRTIGRVAHVVFARPNDFDRAVDRLRNLRRFHGIVVLQPSTKSSTHQQHIHFDVVGIEADRLRHRVANILRNLRRRPDLALRSLKVRGGSSRAPWARAP